MGWFKNVAKSAVKVLQAPFKAGEDILGGHISDIPKDTLGAYTDYATSVLGGNPYKATPAANSNPAASVDNTGRLTQEEIDANLEMSKKLARLGKYFTSPLGALSTASTAGQKVFS